MGISWSYSRGYAWDSRLRTFLWEWNGELWEYHGHGALLLCFIV